MLVTKETASSPGHTWMVLSFTQELNKVANGDTSFLVHRFSFEIFLAFFLQASHTAT
jgi:hypothetical protein